MSAFAGSYAKADRARSVLAELEAELGRFMASTPYTLSGRFDRATEEWVVLVQSAADPPLLLCVLIGDVVHNLRSALDHLAWRLVLRAGGEASWRTQFPIFTGDAAYDQKSQQQTAGMAAADVEQLRALQPFHDSEPELHPLALLASLSNIDKHRVLHAVAVSPATSQFMISSPGDVNAIRGITPIATPLYDGAELARIGIADYGPSPSLDVGARLDLSLVFAEPDLAMSGEDVFGVIEQLESCVLDVIRAFEE